FHDHEFETFFYEGVWRVQGKQGGPLEVYNGGFTDVEALASLRGGLRYVTKYLTKIHRVLGASQGGGGDVEAPIQSFVEASSHGDFSMALMWLFRKRAYSISGSFIDLIRDLHNSKSREVDVHGQVDLWGEAVW
ncbi:unnamed protein product, partial [marine sediment metagenome]